MAPRLELQALLEGMVDNVYFQPPENVKMVYPCIIYNRDFILTDWADDKPYLMRNRYLVTVIDRNPDSVLPDQLAALPLCVYDRFYTADNLNHHVFKLFF